MDYSTACDGVAPTDADPFIAADAWEVDASELASDAGRGLCESGDIQCSVIENRYSPLAKSYALAGDRIEPTSAPHTDADGRAVRACLDLMNWPQQLAAVLHGLTSHQALVTGQLSGAARVLRLVHAQHWRRMSAAKQARHGYRGKQHLMHPQGAPALFLLDFDQKGLPHELAAQLDTSAKLIQVLTRVDPQWGACGLVSRLSVSNGLRSRRDHSITLNSGSLHLYVAIADGSDGERYAAALHERLILAGSGYPFVSKAGSFQPRSPVDLSVSGRPYWLSFEGPAVLSDELEQVPGARLPAVRAGGLIDTRRLASVKGTRRRKLAEAIEALRQNAAKEIAARRGTYCQVEIERRVSRGMTRTDAEAAVFDAVDQQRLPVSGRYLFDDGTVLSGWQILLEQRAAIDRRTSPDPIEPEYANSASKAMWFWRPNRRAVWVHSYAHQALGQHFTLALDTFDLIEVWQRSGNQPVAERLRRLTAAYDVFVASDVDSAGEALKAAGVPSAPAAAFGQSDLAADWLRALVRADTSEAWIWLHQTLDAWGKLGDQALSEATQQAGGNAHG